MKKMKIFHIILGFFHCYQINRRKSRFYHVKYVIAVDCSTDSIVWHSLTAVSKRLIDAVMAKCSIFTFNTTAATGDKG